MTQYQPTRKYTTKNPYDADYAYYERKKKRRARRSAGNIASIIVVLAIIVILLLVLYTYRDAFEDGSLLDSFGPYREYPETADFTVERVITVMPERGGSPMEYEIDIPRPKEIPEDDPWLQEERSITTTPNPNILDSKYPNYTWWVWQDNGVYSTRSFSIKYSMHTESVVWTMESSQSGTVDDIDKWLVDKWGNKTKEEWKILPAHPDIVALSNQLTAGKPTVYDKLWAIFEYLNNNFDYVTLRSGAPKFCYQTLYDRSGDCDDQSVLLISLARAAGIPAWLEFGALYSKSENSWGGHAWTKVYIPNYEGGGYWYNIDIVNDQFLFRDAYRFSEWESDGNGSHLEDYYMSVGRNFDTSERYITESMEVSKKTIKIGEDGRPIDESSIPGFEGVLVVPALLLVALVMRRRRLVSE